ncbi:MAG: murein biosynthesis integral membrane protein MurJ [Nocardioidaceae bacterium]|nr:murein biosynthesis integral membrane protein MurJ [Nocardioidaceae bacterium]
MTQPEQQTPPETGDRQRSDNTSILTSSAVMAAGTVVSRMSGFVRNALLAAALGTQLHADVFTIANTIPNMLYILLAGGVFNAVLVPQLVRAMKHDADRGDAYTNRIITLAALFLAGVTAVLVLTAPVLMRLFLDPSFFGPELASQRESVIDFARYCLPQVFFYGMYVLVGQVLNSRGSFGPMMWAPIANNVIAVLVLSTYLWIYGPVRDLCGTGDPSAISGPGSVVGGFSTGQELLLGLGSTLGIVAQFLVLLPFLRRAGFLYRPRFDFRGTGLGHTLRLGVWTVLFVVVNQVAYTVVVRIASSGTADAVASACEASAGRGTGYTSYSYSFLLTMVPHSIATVSLATAMLPRLSAYAADGDLAGVGRTVASTLRTAYALIVPFALLMPVMALDLADVIFGYGAAGDSVADFAVALSLFAPGLVLFTMHYLMLRGFYALERTRTVFWVQCVIAGTNIVLAVVLTGGVSPAGTAPALVAAYVGSYLVGAVGSYTLLRHVLGGLETPALFRFLARLLLAAAVAAGAAWAVRTGVAQVWPAADGSGPGGSGKVAAFVMLVLTGAVDAGVFLGLARLLRITEVTSIVALVTSRLRR